MNKIIKKDFEMIEHTADIKVRVYGATLQEFFRHALQAMFQAARPRIAHHDANCSVTDDRISCKKLPISHEITISSPDKESLLVDFLSEALCLSDTYNEAYLDAIIHQLTDTEIHATVHGVSIHGFEVVEIKAVTYHDLHIMHTDQGWQADIVFDI